MREKRERKAETQLYMKGSDSFKNMLYLLHYSSEYRSLHSTVSKGVAAGNQLVRKANQSWIWADVYQPIGKKPTTYQLGACKSESIKEDCF